MKAEVDIQLKTIQITLDDDQQPTSSGFRLCGLFGLISLGVTLTGLVIMRATRRRRSGTPAG